MAKISARGDTERWRFRNEKGQELVFTSRGRLLLKSVKGGGFTLVSPTNGSVGEQAALDEAERRGMERV
jgi:hypothetical protein